MNVWYRKVFHRCGPERLAEWVDKAGHLPGQGGRVFRCEPIHMRRHDGRASWTVVFTFSPEPTQREHLEHEGRWVDFTPLLERARRLTRPAFERALAGLDANDGANANIEALAAAAAEDPQVFEAVRAFLKDGPRDMTRESHETV